MTDRPCNTLTTGLRTIHSRTAEPLDKRPAHRNGTTVQKRPYTFLEVKDPKQKRGSSHMLKVNFCRHVRRFFHQNSHTADERDKLRFKVDVTIAPLCVSTRKLRYDQNRKSLFSNNKQLKKGTYRKQSKYSDIFKVTILNRRKNYLNQTKLHQTGHTTNTKLAYQQSAEYGN